MVYLFSADLVMNGPLGDWVAERLKKNKLEVLSYSYFRSVGKKQPQIARFFTPDLIKSAT
jgi:hypothetical protein